MRLSLIYCIALSSSVAFAACKQKKDDQAQPLTCGDSEVARDYCCDDPSDFEDEASCERMCFLKCETDDDCAGSVGQTCQDGACAESPDDCYVR